MMFSFAVERGQAAFGRRISATIVAQRKKPVNPTCKSANCLQILRDAHGKPGADVLKW
jgi:hypothetical protein